MKLKLLNRINATIGALLLTCICRTAAFFDPISLGGAAAIGAGIAGYGLIKDQTYCRMVECCNDYNIPGDFADLNLKLHAKLFGQHIVIKHLVAALEAHFSPNSKSTKPLVISFHGTPGTGKNYVADMIAESLYKHGLKSKYVHKYLGRADFPLVEKTQIYKERINKEVREGIAQCPRSLFIFDEVDKMPPGVFESLASLVDYNAVVERQDYTKAIFIFLTNTAGVQISDRLGKLMQGGSPRKDSKLSDFEQILQLAAYNLEGGLKKTSLIESHAIDHYLPFLPLEKEHVVMCLVAEFGRWGVVAKEEAIEKIIKNDISYDRSYGLFSTSGCKTLEKKVAVQVMVDKRKY